MERIPATNDLAFKKVLASEENKDILQGFIKDFFGVTAEDIVIENPYSINVYKEALESGGDVNVLRHTLKDVSASFKTADFVSEIQIKKTKFYDERALYYLFERFCRNYNKEGAMETGADGRPERYSSIRPVYGLNILGHTHYSEDEDALRIFEMYDVAHGKAYKKALVKAGFFELSKPKVETVNQGYWKTYFTTGEVDGMAPEYIRKASGIIEYINLQEEERKMVTMMEKAQAIYDADMVSSYLDGKEETEKKYEAEIAETAKKHEVEIAEAAKKYEAEIKKLQDKIKELEGKK